MDQNTVYTIPNREKSVGEPRGLRGLTWLSMDHGGLLSKSHSGPMARLTCGAIVGEVFEACDGAEAFAELVVASGAL